MGFLFLDLLNKNMIFLNYIYICHVSKIWRHATILPCNGFLTQKCTFLKMSFKDYGPAVMEKVLKLNIFEYDEKLFKQVLGTAIPHPIVAVLYSNMFNVYESH